MYGHGIMNILDCANSIFHNHKFSHYNLALGKFCFENFAFILCSYKLLFTVRSMIKQERVQRLHEITKFFFETHANNSKLVVDTATLSVKCVPIRFPVYSHRIPQAIYFEECFL